MAAKQTGQSARKAPISRHPAFPAIVALWFAALLGGGSLVVPGALFENLIVATGLPSAIPAAQPPLDMGGRILIALVGAGLGAIAGLYIARKVADAQDSRPAKRPISAREELGAGSFDEPVEETHADPVRKRLRTLTSIEANYPVAPVAEAAPVTAMTGADTRSAEAAPFAAPPLDLAAFAAPGETAEAEHEASGRPLPGQPDAQPAPSADSDDDIVAPQEQAATPAPADPSCTVTEERPLHELSIAELVERFALSLQRAAERAEAAAAPEEKPENAPTEHPSGASATRYVPDLGVGMDEAPAPGLAGEIPAALRPIPFEEPEAEWEDDDCLSFSLPLANVAADGDDEDDDGPSAEDGYSSLLNIRPTEAHRIPPLAEAGDEAFESAPVVPFPADGDTPAPLSAPHRPFDAPASADRAQAEHALREALHKLQQMSGAA